MFIKKISIVLSTLLIGLSASANSDLELPGEKWLASHTGYICNAFGEEISAPASHALYNVEFTGLSTDSSLDNVLVKAKFEQDGATCSYSLILLADNAAGTTTYVDSKAYATSGASDCLAGKELLDEQLTANNYLYWGHPHHVSLVIEENSAATLCGAGALTVAVDFVVSGVIRR